MREAAVRVLDGVGVGVAVLVVVIMTVAVIVGVRVAAVVIVAVRVVVIVCVAGGVRVGMGLGGRRGGLGVRGDQDQRAFLGLVGLVRVGVPAGAVRARVVVVVLVSGPVAMGVPCPGPRWRQARRTRVAPAQATMTPLAMPSQAITEGAAAEPAVTRRPRATTPRVWVTVTEAARGMTSLRRARPPRAAAVAAIRVLPCPGASACIAPRTTAMSSESAAKPTVRSWRATRLFRACVQRSAPRGGTEAAGASCCSSTRAGPPARTRSEADEVSAGRRATPWGSW